MRKRITDTAWTPDNNAKEVEHGTGSFGEGSLLLSGLEHRRAYP